MKPLNWRREQQLALIIAAIIGLMLGEFSGFALTSDGERFGLWMFCVSSTSLYVSVAQTLSPMSPH